MSDENLEDASSDSKDTFDFFYEKSFGYRAVHADGFIVSPNAKGAIAITFYSERLTIPKHVRLEFGDDSDTEEEVIDGKDGILRQMEFTTFIDGETAQELRDWLERAISAIRRDRVQESDQGGADV